MEHIEAFLQSASYFGVIKKLMAMSATDVAVIFLVSKPAFLLTAGLAVLTARRHRQREELPEGDEPAGFLAE